ncbi:hypothetical protein NDA11_002798 [Ustilago hordei]|uniref:Probable mitochondrial p32 family protein n=1 Tax=Ustilago hordei TaxID=120017 RepID=I2FPA7_USTHO|nr:putative mitochondrial p32 family protein [Ustilago hordei]KAJ1037979.1 hypothetical protein NDA10_002897 [Ustilago hordei]KAJ1584386.1 hypothetical protein NDA12_005887 [Ustilago hordei]KAJ1593428.1 hypothetical protein NDA15_000736 [Ustilago hordei]KAJ1595575.1 hypothetical protein NDA11_002798 [Ustilago hordei]KAJ1603716.1 hypothetical protein NDA14_005606 [Ustilago hordei]
MIARNLSRTLLRAAPRAPTTAARAAILPRFTPVIAPTFRTFFTTPTPRGSGETDLELSAKLAQELSYEKENSDLFTSSSSDSPSAEPGFVTEFKQAGIWKITDKAMVDEVILSRDFGNEHIEVMFSVGEIDTSGPLPSEEDVDEAPAPEEESEDGATQFPVRISATITKPTDGALMIDAFVQDGEVHVDNIAYYKDKELATKIDADADFARKAVYLGPTFETLDDGLQEQFRAFLAERGVDANLALFVPNYAEYKEQREYCAWLGHVRQFIDA